MKKTFQEIKSEVEYLGYHFLSEHLNKSKVRMVEFMDKDGYLYVSALKNLRKHKPYFVGVSNPHSLKNISRWLKLNGKKFRLCKNNIYNGSEKKLFFKCSDRKCLEISDATWEAILAGNNCPFCSGHRVGRKNNLKYLRPDLVLEWDYNKNKRMPEEYVCGSEVEVWWVCDKRHHWISRIDHRVTGSGCSKCSEEEKESYLARDLKKFFKENYGAKTEYKILKNPKTGMWLPYDIYIPYGENPDLNGFYIEVHGIQHYRFIQYWHKTEDGFKYQKHKDKIKKRFAKKFGFYIVIDIRKEKSVEKILNKIYKNKKFNSVFMKNTGENGQ